MVKALKKQGLEVESEATGCETEEEIGEKFWALIVAAELKGIDAESALRRKCQMLYETVR